MNRGFTLVELMVTVAVLAIIAAFAAPSFTRVIEDNRVTTQANDLLTSIALARSEAVKRGATVTISPAAGGYGAGWQVFVGTAGAPGAVLRNHEALSQVAMSGAHLNTAISFDSFGANMAQANRTIELSPPNCTSGDTRKRQLVVNPIGHGSITVVGC